MMNKDKVIKDLKERNNSLNNQNRLKEIRCVHLEYKVQEQEKEIERKKETINVMIDNEEEYCLEINRLNNIINKAIDFLKENACIDEDVEYFCDDLRYDDCKKLLDILKGVDKE